MNKISSITIVLVFLLLSALIPQAGASISPTSLVATLNPGESIIDNKTVEITAVPPKADVLFSFDLTGSMGSIISTAKSQSGNIMTSLDATGVDINYGVASYMDYPHSYSSFGYSGTYGSSSYGDYAYRLDSPITNDRTAVSSTINSLVLGSGYDGPQDYTRIMYESYADPAISWRTGAKKILLNFGDNIPHDNNLYEGVSGYSGTYSTGGDPGRNEIMDETSDPSKIGVGNDDLDLQTVLAGMASNNVILLESHSSTSGFTEAGWTYWTGITGGKLFTTDSSTLPDDVVAEITKALTTITVDNVHLVASSGYESWISSSDSYTGPTGVTVPLGLTITVPSGTPAGEYKFTVSAVDSSGVSYGDQDVNITVGGAVEEGSIDVEKYVWNGTGWEDADTITGPSLYSGPVKFKIIVTNNGSVELTGISVTDSKYGPVTLSTTTLAVGASTEAEYEMAWASGQQVNTAEVEGYYGSTKYTDSDDANYYGPVSQEAQYDNRLRESSSCVVFSKATYLDVGKSVSRSRDVLWFDLSKFNKTDKVSKATLSLFWYYPEGATRPSDTVVDIYRPIKWDPNYVTWYYVSQNKKWPIVGGTWFDKNNVAQGSTPYGSVTFPASTVPDNKYYEFDVTQLVQQYINGTYENTGFFLKARTESGNYIAFYSSDYSNAAMKPKLNVYLDGASAPTIPVAPTGSAYAEGVADNRLRQNKPAVVYSTTTYIDIGKSQNSTSRDVLLFDLSAYEPTDTISKATLSLHWYYAASGRTSDTVVDIYRPAQEWDPKYVSWNNYANGVRWGIAGGDWVDKNGDSQGSVPYASVTFPKGTAPDNKYYEFDVTELVQAYIRDDYENTGFFLKARTESNNYIAFYSLDYPDAAMRPKLNITR